MSTDISKFRIWLIDDLADQRDLVIGALLRTREDISKKNRVKHARECFEIIEFDSAKKAEEELEKIPYSLLPDFIICDNNFQHALDSDPNDRSEDRGLRFLEFAKKCRPEIPSALVTQYEINRFWEKILNVFKEESVIALSHSIFIISKSAATEESACWELLNKTLRKIASHILMGLDEQNIYPIASIIHRAGELNELLDLQLVCKNDRRLFLRSLLAPWGELAYDEAKREVELTFDQVSLFDQLKIWFPPSNVRPQIFTGQLNVTPGDNDPEQTKSLKDQVKEFIETTQKKDVRDPSLKAYKDQAEKVIQSFFTHNQRWIRVHSREDLSAENQRFIFNNHSGEDRILSEFRNQVKPDHLKIRPSTKKNEKLEIWNNILTGRLVVVGIYALRQRGAILGNLPFAIDFAIHCVMRNNVKDFFGILGEVLDRFAVIEECSKRGQARQNTTAYFNSFFGLSGSRTNGMRENECLYQLNEERLNLDSLFPYERNWYFNILQGKRLPNLINIDRPG